MALELPKPHGIRVKVGFDYGLLKAADLAEAREKELLEQISNREQYTEIVMADGTKQIQKLKAERAQMIAELRGLAEYDTGVYEFYPIDAEHMMEIIEKYEVMK